MRFRARLQGETGGRTGIPVRAGANTLGTASNARLIHRPGRVVVAASVAIGTLLFAGCGNYTKIDFEGSTKALASIAAEGSLMADDQAHGRTLTSFVRAHGQDLSDQAQHEAEKLHDAPLAPGLAAKVRVAIELASSIGSSIDDMRVAPDDRGVARRAARDLRTDARRVQALEASA
jgi:hypothetical protein